MIAGGGVLYSEAEDELVELARTNGVPVAETFAGKGAVQVPEWFQLGGLGLEGNPAASRVAMDADLVIAVGTRLTDFATGSNSLFQHPDVRFVAINAWGRDAAKQGALPVVGDAREALAALRAALEGWSTTEDYRAEVTQARAEWLEQRAALHQPVDGEAMSQAQLILTLNEIAQAGDTVITRRARRQETC